MLAPSKGLPSPPPIDLPLLRSLHQAVLRTASTPDPAAASNEAVQVLATHYLGDYTPRRTHDGLREMVTAVATAELKRRLKTQGDTELATQYLLALCRAGLATGRHLHLVLSSLPESSSTRIAALMQSVLKAAGAMPQQAGWTMAVHHGLVKAGDIRAAVASAI
eukprot:SAG31_NODE_2481_length_5630_cov_2.585005_2_plen_164_part_00